MMKMSLRRDNILSLLIGAVAGLSGGLMGVGGGWILVPMLCSVLKLPQHLAHATSLAAMILLSLAGAVSYAMQGYVDWGVALVMAMGSCVSVVIGARFMARVPAKRLRQGFGVLLLVVAVRMFIG